MVAVSPYDPVALAGAGTLLLGAAALATVPPALRAAGVDCGQGFYWSRAVPGAEVEAVLRRGFAEKLQRPAHQTTGSEILLQGQQCDEPGAGPS